MKIFIGSDDFSWMEPLINMSAVLLGAALAWVTSYYFELKKQKKFELTTSYSMMFKVISITD